MDGVKVALGNRGMTVRMNLPSVAALGMQWPPVPKVSGSIPLTTLDFQCTFACRSGSQEVLSCNEWGVTASQLHLPSLMPYSATGCG